MAPKSYTKLKNVCYTYNLGRGLALPNPYIYLSYSLFKLVLVANEGEPGDEIDSETQLDINFQITDLSKGQLAEANIAGFDSSRKPNKSDK